MLSPPKPPEENLQQTKCESQLFHHTKHGPNYQWKKC